MLTIKVSNWRAVFFPVVLIGALLGPVLPAWGAVHLTDETGSGGTIFGAAVSELEDINGDGKWELLVGAPGAPNGGNHGEVFLWLGGSELTVKADFQWTGVNQEKFGYAVARIGDVNNDGRPDWAVGAPDSPDGGAFKGKVYIFYGQANLGSINPVGIIGEIGGDNFGFSISAAGDFNNDNIDDFIVGAPGIASGTPGRPGYAYVIFGKNGGVSTDLGDALKLTGEIAGNAFGYSVTDAGNFMGGEDCVAVGAPLNDTHGGTNAGAVYVFEGGFNPNATADHEIGIGGTAPNSQYGFAVRGVGDWGGSSLYDLAIGGPFNNDAGAANGRVEIVYGDNFGPSTTGDRYVLGELPGDNLGYSLARIWDFTQNGSDDVLIGAPFHNLPGVDCGKGYVYQGGSATTNAANLEIKGNVPMKPGAEANDNYSYAVSSAGDFDGDGDKDLAVGAPYGNKENDAVTGFVHLLDSSDLVVPAFFSRWNADWDVDGGRNNIRLSFAFALPAVQFQDVEIFRQILDTQGSILDESVIWGGSPRLDPSEAPGVLTVSGEGFAYLDHLPADLPAEAAAVSYSLSAVTDDGFAFSLEALAGPGELGALLNVGSVLALDPAWPNPANPAVTIRFRAAPVENITVRIIDLRGRLVRELFQGTGTGNWQNIIWNGRTDRGTTAASGLYFISLESGIESLRQRVVLAR